MPKGQKRGGNVVKIQVEAKAPKQTRRKFHPRAPSAGIPKALIDNFVGLQRVQANLAEKIDALTKQITELLRLFESTAKTFAENPAILTSERDKEFIDKINKLLEQDKIIAKGVIYIEDRLDEIEKALPMPHHEQAIHKELKNEYAQSQVARPLPKA